MTIGRSRFKSIAGARLMAIGVVMAVAAVYVTIALAAVTVNLHAPHVGASSMTFQGRSADPVPSVTWHFVLNGLEKDSTPGSITVTFKNAGTKSGTACKVAGGTQHFNITTPGHDILVGATATVEAESADKLKLLLSNVAVTKCPPPPPPPPPPPDDGDEDTCTPPPPPDDGDEDTCTPPPPPDDGDEDTTTPPPPPDDGDEDTTTPGASDENDDEPFLPFTGGELFTLLASGFVAAGLGLNLRERAARSEETEDGTSG